MTDDDFDVLVAEALDQIPAEFAQAMDNVVVMVEDRHPTRDLFGLYHGINLTRRGNYQFTAPDTITIYRRPILARATTVEQARTRVTRTVMHEVGHHFGLDDARLHELGY